MPALTGVEPGVDRVRPGHRVFLHIGPPKTGTSYLQSVLWTNKDRLREAGVLVPGSGQSPHFAAAGDLRDRWQRRGRTRSPGKWDALAAEVRAWPGTSVISCEWLAYCDDAQVRRGLGSFEGTEVHVVVTLRDLGRVLPAVWQEQIKNGNDFTMQTYLQQLAHPEGNSFGRLFWSVHDPREVLDRWGRELPRGCVHVVTLPPSGARPDELWRRFSSLFVSDPEVYDLSQVRANPGLAPAEAEMLRRVNHELGGRLGKAAHGPLVKGFLHQELTKQSRSGTKVRLPPDMTDMAADRAREIVAALTDGGYPVVGDLTDLQVDPGRDAPVMPENSPEEAVSRAAIRSMAAMLTIMQTDGAHKRKVWRSGGQLAEQQAQGAERHGVGLARWAARAARHVAGRA